MRRLLLRVLLAVVLVELGLQLVDRLRYESQLISLGEPPVAGQVMFVGDDFVFDAKAPSRDESWPKEVCRGLGTARNLARPMLDSARLLSLLPAWLDIYRPEVVYVGIGAGDLRRNDVGAVSEDQIPGRSLPYRMHCQIGSLLTGWLGSGARPEGSLGFLGVWHHSTTEVEFVEPATLRMDERVADWRIDGDELLVTLPGEEPSVVGWEIKKGQLRLSSDLLGGTVRLEPGPVAVDASARARQALHSGRLDEARWINEVALRSADVEVGDHVIAVEIAAAEGAWDKVAVELAILREQAAASAADGPALVAGLLAAGESAEAVELAMTAPVALARSEPRLCRRVGRAAADTDLVEVFIRVMAATREVPPGVERTLAFTCAESLRRLDPEGALRFAIRGLDPAAGPVPVGPDSLPEILRSADQDRVCALIEDPAVEAAVLGWREQRQIEEDAALATLRHNLELALRVARGYASRVVVLDLDGDDALSRVRREAAAEMGLTCLSAPAASLPAAVRVDLEVGQGGD